MKKDFAFLSVFLFAVAGFWCYMTLSFPYSDNLALKIVQVVGFFFGFLILTFYASAMGYMAFTFNDTLSEVVSHYRVEEQDPFMQEALLEVELFLKNEEN